MTALGMVGAFILASILTPLLGFGALWILQVLCSLPFKIAEKLKGEDENGKG
jgi:hypothetical protein